MSLVNTEYNNAETITKSDTVNFDGTASTENRSAVPANAIYVGGAGTVIAVFPDGGTATFTCVAGQLLPVRAIRVGLSSTATLMLAMYAV